jgi:hypothetical protein
LVLFIFISITIIISTFSRLHISCWLFWGFWCLISWVILVKLILWEDAIICRDVSSLLNRNQSFNFRFVLLLNSHCFDFVDLVQISNFALN